MGDPTPLRYDPEAVEAKWQARWAERRTNEPDLDRAARPFFNLMMFPYPSAEGLHVGNMFAFTGSDTYGRFKRLQGFDVFEPIGFDAFGIHSENYAIKLGIHPAELIPRNIANFTRQLTRIGGMFAWEHALSTTDPAYYKWTQWLFLQLYQAGKAYRKHGLVNWCPECKTVLANEQVINGFCERHPGTRVEQRALEQWYFRITDYAERLLANLDDKSKMDWSDTTTQAQRNWLGRSEGAEVDFVCEGDAGAIRVFTTRPDTLYGATFLVLAPEHPLVAQLTTKGQRKAVDAYRTRVAGMDLVSRKVGDKDKTGVFTGAHAVNPATGGKIPVWVADYVLMEYGTGAIMAVPGHDERDFDFARKFQLPIVRVLAKEGQPADAPLEAADTDTEGYVLVHSGPTPNGGAPGAAGHHGAAGKRRGKEEGHPVPALRRLVHLASGTEPASRSSTCPACGPVPVPEKDLPVLLPPIDDFRPDDSGVSPLARHEEWYYVPCPSCGARARRETDVSDTFLDSAWYYLRYPSTEFTDRPFDPARTRKWCPVPMYIGGNEHAVLHLLYSRFIAMVLQELGHLDFEEPFRTFRAHGLIVKDGAKMSKSKGNVVIPDEYIAKWGADTFRIYLMFLGPFQEGGDFRDSGISGPRRFLDKVWDLVSQCEHVTLIGSEVHQSVVIKRHQTVKKVSEAMEALSYNTAIAALMELLNTLRETNCSDRRLVKDLLIMLAPFAPHFAEECWERMGSPTTIFQASWPQYEAHLTVEDLMDIPVQVNGKTRGKVRVPRGAEEAAIVAAATREEAVRRFTEGKELRKQIYVPGRLLNLVVG